jgi:ATP-dependent helicase/nuclease subunit B
VSSARMEKESELAPSPLIASLPLAALEELDVAQYPVLRDAMRRHAALEAAQDARAPSVEAGSHAGGTRLFKDQAACPFRAVARHRLHSRPLETPRPGLDARDRGTLVHEMMHAVWKALGSRERLVALDAAALATLLESCADAAIAGVKRFRGAALEGRFGELERARLVGVARDWLELERRRGDFEVVATEEKHARTFGGITVNVKLDRLDRIEGGVAVIDYKTGVCRTADWMGDRPEEPQVPMYAVSLGAEVAAVAFGVVKTGEHRFRGVARTGEPIPRVCTIDKDRSGRKHYRDWDQLVEGWRVSLEALGQGYRCGDARVDPKRGALTCENCDQHAFCRIAEKAPLAAWGEREGEADE